MGDGELKQAVLSVLFSTRPPNHNNFNGMSPKWVQEQVDHMFDSLELENHENHNVKEAMIGDFLNIADFENRYTYVGTETTPPCANGTLWNIAQ